LGGSSSFDGVHVRLSKTKDLIAKSKDGLGGIDEHFIVTVSNSVWRPSASGDLSERKNLFVVDESVLDLYFSPSIGLALKYFNLDS
jgi:hypothetical protein